MRKLFDLAIWPAVAEYTMQQWTPPAGIFTTPIFRSNEDFVKNMD
jgi:hypothetical protein